MDTSAKPAATSIPHRRVRTDLLAGTTLLAVVVGGNVLWRLSDAGIVSALAGR